MPTLAVIWSAGGLLLATGIDSVVEVLAPLAWTPAPTAPSWVRGLFSHRGRLVPLLDACELLGTPRPPDRMSNRVLVVRCALDQRASPCVAGLWVQRVVELERLDFAEAGGHPGFATDAGRFLGPVVQTRFGQVQLLKPESLFTPEQAAVLSERLREAAA